MIQAQLFVMALQFMELQVILLGLFLGSYGYIDEQGDLSQAPTGVHQFESGGVRKYIKVVVSAGGSGSGNGFIFSARGEGSAPLLIDDRVIYAIQVHDNANHYAVRVADKATGEILQCPMNDREWPQWAGVTRTNRDGEQMELLTGKMQLQVVLIYIIFIA